MAHPTLRRVVVLLSGALLLTAFVVAATRTSTAEAQQPARHAFTSDAQLGSTVRESTLARAAATWRGGLITASTGETVDVRVADDLPPETTPESWAEFLVGLDHGSELSQLTTYIGTLDDVQGICGSDALGCYAQDQMVVPADASFDVSPQEIARHEYGHHIAFHRSNPPWDAIDWGPKHWASFESICARASRKEVYPGDEGANYALNPGEAWAETYRILEERKAGITTGSWQIVAPSFYPNDAALQAAQTDVLQPWTAAQSTSVTRVFGKKTKKVWWIPLKTPLDGDLKVNAAVRGGGNPEVVLVAANRSTVVKRAQWVSQRVKTLDSSVCGQRSFFVRVTQKGALGQVRITTTTP